MQNGREFGSTMRFTSALHGYAWQMLWLPAAIARRGLATPPKTDAVPPPPPTQLMPINGRLPATPAAALRTRQRL
jgi:hypothetical protein